jgi:hypothetical protein
MLAINSNGVLVDQYAKQKFLLKKYSINTLVFVWKAFFKTLAVLLKLGAFVLIIVSYIFLGMTAILLLLFVTRRR